MTILRRKDQQSEDRYSGVTRRVLTGSDSGSTMLSVGDVVIQPGAKIPYHVHPNVEESMYVAEGDLVMKLDGKSFDISSGDCVLALKGIGHGLENISQNPARLITVFPDVSPEVEQVDFSDFKDEIPEKNVSFRSKMDGFEFAPGIKRFDIVGDFLGAESTYFSELIFEPGATSPNHYHPHHEESMFCYRGNLNAVYGENDNIPLEQGDMFTCEIGIRHTVNNLGNQQGTLLAIHPVLNPPPKVMVD